MSDTTVVVENYLRELRQVDGAADAEAIVKSLLSKACHRLSKLCRMYLAQHYPRLTRPPQNLTADELLSAAVERLIKALRQVRPGSVRQFYSLAGQHIRWELNDLARRLDERPAMQMYLESPATEDSGSVNGSSVQRMLDAIEKLPQEEREVFELVRIQGLSHIEASQILEVVPKTIQRRLNRALLTLSETLADLATSARLV